VMMVYDNKGEELWMVSSDSDDSEWIWSVAASAAHMGESG